MENPIMSTDLRFRETPFGRFLLAPFALRSWANLLFLALAFPLGLLYFVFLVVGLSVGLGLTIVWIGLPILALVFAGVWGFAKLERGLAIHLLGAEVPPMAGPAAPQGLWPRVKTFFSNPVTWKGLGYLAVKFPLGLASFISSLVLLSISLAFLALPILYFLPVPDPEITLDLWSWQFDTLPRAFAGCGIGVVLTLVSINLLNLLALGWRELATAMLGSRRFTSPVETGPAAA